MHVGLLLTCLASLPDTEMEAERESKYLSGRKLVLVFTGMLLSVLLIALDQTILAYVYLHATGICD